MILLSLVLAAAAGMPQSLGAQILQRQNIDPNNIEIILKAINPRQRADIVAQGDGVPQALNAIFLVTLDNQINQKILARLAQTGVAPANGDVIDGYLTGLIDQFKRIEGNGADTDAIFKNIIDQFFEGIQQSIQQSAADNAGLYAQFIHQIVRRGIAKDLLKYIYSEYMKVLLASNANISEFKEKNDVNINFTGLGQTFQTAPESVKPIVMHFLDRYEAMLASFLNKITEIRGGGLQAEIQRHYQSSVAWKGRADELEAQLDQLNDEYDALQAQSEEEAEQARLEMERLTTQIEQRAGELTRLADRHQLSERQKAGLELQLGQLQEALERAAGDNEAIQARAGEEKERLRQELHNKEVEFAAAKARLEEQLKAQVEAARVKEEAARQALEAQRQQMESAAEKAREAEAQLTSEVEQLTQAQQQLKRSSGEERAGLEAQLRGLEEAKGRQEEELIEARRASEVKAAEFGSVQARLMGELEAARKEVATAVQEIEALRAEAERKTDESAKAIAEKTAETARLTAQLKEKEAALQAAQVEATAKAEKARQEFVQLAESFAQQTEASAAERERAEKAMGEAEARHSAALAEQEAIRVRLEQASGEKDRTMRDQAATIIQLQGALEASQTSLEKARQESQEKDGQIGILRGGNAALEAELNALRARVADLEELLARQAEPAVSQVPAEQSPQAIPLPGARTPVKQVRPTSSTKPYSPALLHQHGWAGSGTAVHSTKGPPRSAGGPQAVGHLPLETQRHIARQGATSPSGRRSPSPTPPPTPNSSFRSLGQGGSRTSSPSGVNRPLSLSGSPSEASLVEEEQPPQQGTADVPELMATPPSS